METRLAKFDSGPRASHSDLRQFCKPRFQIISSARSVIYIRLSRLSCLAPRLGNVGKVGRTRTILAHFFLCDAIRLMSNFVKAGGTAAPPPPHPRLRCSRATYWPRLPCSILSHLSRVFCPVTLSRFVCPVCPKLPSLLPHTVCPVSSCLTIVVCICSHTACLPLCLCLLVCARLSSVVRLCRLLLAVPVHVSVSRSPWSRVQLVGLPSLAGGLLAAVAGS